MLFFVLKIVYIHPSNLYLQVGFWTIRVTADGQIEEHRIKVLIADIIRHFFPSYIFHIYPTWKFETKV